MLADKDSQLAILKLCKLLWGAAKGKNMVIVGPTARFITASCCLDQMHAANMGSIDFYPKLKEELTASCRNIKDLLFTYCFRHGRVMDRARTIYGLAAAEIWKATQCTPNPKYTTYWTLGYVRWSSPVEVVS